MSAADAKSSTIAAAPSAGAKSSASALEDELRVSEILFRADEAVAGISNALDAIVLFQSKSSPMTDSVSKERLAVNKAMEDVKDARDRCVDVHRKDLSKSASESDENTAALCHYDSKLRVLTTTLERFTKSVSVKSPDASVKWQAQMAQDMKAALAVSSVMSETTRERSARLIQMRAVRDFSIMRDPRDGSNTIGRDVPALISEKDKCPEQKLYDALPIMARVMCDVSECCHTSPEPLRVVRSSWLDSNQHDITGSAVVASICADVKAAERLPGKLPFIVFIERLSELKCALDQHITREDLYKRVDSRNDVKHSKLLYDRCIAASNRIGAARKAAMIAASGRSGSGHSSRTSSKAVTPSKTPIASEPSTPTPLDVKLQPLLSIKTSQATAAAPASAGKPAASAAAAATTPIKLDEQDRLMRHYSMFMRDTRELESLKLSVADAFDEVDVVYGGPLGTNEMRSFVTVASVKARCAIAVHLLKHLAESGADPGLVPVVQAHILQAGALCKDPSRTHRFADEASIAAYVSKATGAELVSSDAFAKGWTGQSATATDDSKDAKLWTWTIARTQRRTAARTALTSGTYRILLSASMEPGEKSRTIDAELIDVADIDAEVSSFLKMMSNRTPARYLLRTTTTSAAAANGGGGANASAAFTELSRTAQRHMRWRSMCRFESDLETRTGDVAKNGELFMDRLVFAETRADLMASSLRVRASPPEDGAEYWSAARLLCCIETLSATRDSLKTKALTTNATWKQYPADKRDHIFKTLQKLIAGLKMMKNVCPFLSKEQLMLLGFEAESHAAALIISPRRDDAFFPERQTVNMFSGKGPLVLPDATALKYRATLIAESVELTCSNRFVDAVMAFWMQCPTAFAAMSAESFALTRDLLVAPWLRRLELAARYRMGIASSQVISAGGKTASAQTADRYAFSIPSCAAATVSSKTQVASLDAKAPSTAVDGASVGIAPLLACGCLTGSTALAQYRELCCVVFRTVDILSAIEKTRRAFASVRQKIALTAENEDQLRQWDEAVNATVLNEQARMGRVFDAAVAQRGTLSGGSISGSVAFSELLSSYERDTSARPAIIATAPIFEAERLLHKTFIQLANDMQREEKRASADGPIADVRHETIGLSTLRGVRRMMGILGDMILTNDESALDVEFQSFWWTRARKAVRDTIEGIPEGKREEAKLRLHRAIWNNNVPGVFSVLDASETSSAEARSVIALALISAFQQQSHLISPRKDGASKEMQRFADALVVHRKTILPMDERVFDHFSSLRATWARG